MKRRQMIPWIIAALCMIFWTLGAATVLAADQTVVGTVNDNYQLVTSGQTYEIADTAEGNDLAENHISAKVKVTGKVEERDDMKIITIISYQVLSE